MSGLHVGVEKFLKRLKESGEERNVPNISWNTADFLRDQIISNDYKSVLEIGSANGFSTIHLAEAIRRNQDEQLPGENTKYQIPNAKGEDKNLEFGIRNLELVGAGVVSIDLSRHAYEEARENFMIYEKILDGADPDGFDPSVKPPKVKGDVYSCCIGNIDYYFGNALEVLPFVASSKLKVQSSKKTSSNLPAGRKGLELNTSNLINVVGEKPPTAFTYSSPTTFDFIFIDGRFIRTLDFYLLCRPLLNSGGMIVVDDVVKYRWKMEDFYEYLEKNSIGYKIEMLDEDDGVMVI